MYPAILGRYRRRHIVVKPDSLIFFEWQSFSMSCFDRPLYVFPEFELVPDIRHKLFYVNPNIIGPMLNPVFQPSWKPHLSRILRIHVPSCMWYSRCKVFKQLYIISCTPQKLAKQLLLLGRVYTCIYPVPCPYTGRSIHFVLSRLI